MVPKNIGQIGVVIVGAGSSQRMGVDKVFLPLAGKPVLAWSVDVCQNCELLQSIVIVLHWDKLDLGRKLAAERGWSKVSKICAGGERRQDSVRLGLDCLEDCSWVVIHDVARPFLTSELVRDGLVAATATGAAAAAVRVKDTIKQCNDDLSVIGTLDRRQLWAVQTPQVFRFDIIARAHEEMTADATDDASMVEQLGYQVKLYPGSYDNMKITTREDLALAELIARNRRSGRKN